MVSASSFESFEAAAAASAVDKSSNNDETRNSHCHNEGEPQYPITASEEANNNALESSKKRKRRPTASLLKKAMEELDNIWINVDKDGNHHDDETNCNTNNNNNYREAQLALGHALPPSEMDRVRKTTALLVNVLTQDIHEPAIRALVANEELKSTQLKLKSELEMSQKEVERLRRSEQRSKEAIKNLLKAVGESAEHTKDVSQTKLVEAKMRADLLHVISERDAAHKDSMVAQRRVELLSNDVANLKTEKTKLQHDKLRLEREVRSARALADGLSSSLLSSNNSGNHHHRDDLDYYKGKAKELETHLQGMTARMAEKNKEIQELRRCNDRNWSQQRLQTLKAAQEPSISTSDRVRKHPRHSY